MPIPADALALENRSIGSRPEPTLGAAFVLLRDAWDAGERDRELALHLAFLAWYLIVEPPHLTGAPKDMSGAMDVFDEAHAFLLPHGASSDDAEALYAIGLAAHMFPWVPGRGDADEWTARAEAYRKRYRELRPHGIDPATFEGRGAYGAYYASQSDVERGY
jgi:hypothetical protein